MRYSFRPTRITLGAVSVAACCLLSCGSPPPTPIISGPDSGLVRAPVRFRAFDPDGKPTGYAQYWLWGDSASSATSIHAYAAPGSYMVTCYLSTWPETYQTMRYSGTSDPHTIRILDDTLVFPDTLVDTVPLGYGIKVRACIVPDGSRLYVARAEADSVSVVETQTNSVVAVVAVQDSPVCCNASGSGEYVHVLNARSGTVSVIRTSDNTVADTIDVGTNPTSLALPNDSLLYVGYADTNIVAAYRLDDDSCVARVALPGVPSGISVKPNGEYVYVASESDNCVAVVRVSDNTVTSSATLSGGPVSCAFSPGGETAYVPCPVSEDIALLRASDLTTLQRVSYDSLDVRGIRYVAGLPGGPCLYATAPTNDPRFVNSNCVDVLRRSDNYLLRICVLENTGIAGPAIPLPDGSRVYVPTSNGLFVLGLRPGR
jgi:YVTN family beta-propeller protein